MRVVAIELTIDSLIDLIDFSKMLQLLHCPIPSLYLPPVSMFYYISLSDKPLLLHLPPGLSNTDLPACPLPYPYFLLDGLSECLVTHHLVLEVGTCTCKLMWVLVLYDDWHGFFVY